jgi:hypothetical protein
VGTHKQMTKDYRKIYQDFYQVSLLPGIDIHHIDGDHNNNHPLNLQAVTLQEHYDIHKKQGNHYACYMISLRMDIKPNDWTEMARLNGRKSAIKNMKNGIGLTVWAKQNPELAKSMWTENGKKGSAVCIKHKLGIHGLSKEEKIKIASQGGKKSAELGLGFKSGNASDAGKIGGAKGGAYAKQNRTGIFALTPEQIKEKNVKAAITKMIKSGRASAWPKKEL